MWLVNNASGTAANITNTPKPNRFLGNPASWATTTIYAWAANWAGASVQLQVSPTQDIPGWTPKWFNIGDPIIADTNPNISFPGAWAQIQAVVTGATSDTSGLNVSVVSPL